MRYVLNFEDLKKSCYPLEDGVEFVKSVAFLLRGSEKLHLLCSARFLRNYMYIVRTEIFLQNIQESFDGDLTQGLFMQGFNK